MKSIYVVILVAFLSSCYATNPLSCYFCLGDSISDIAPGCFDPFDPDGKNIAIVNCSSLIPKRLGVNGVQLSKLEENDGRADEPDYECGAVQIEEPESGIKVIERSCFIRGSDNECEEAAEEAEELGILLTKCVVCYEDFCNSA